MEDSKVGKLSSGHRTEKGQFSFQSKRNVMQRMPKLPHNCNISHASKVMLKILQAMLQQYMTMNFQTFKLVLEKAEEPEIKLPSSTG